MNTDFSLLCYQKSVFIRVYPCTNHLFLVLSDRLLESVKTIVLSVLILNGL